MVEKYPSEIFGHPHYATDEKAVADRRNYWCPFVDKVCYKQSRLINHPFGVCSARVGEEQVALCPRRFLDNHSVFSDIARHHFKTINDILVFPEIHLKDIGSFDFVMLKHKPMSVEIADFVVIEFQTGQTTGTGKLVEGLTDFLAGRSLAYKSYNFGLNTYDIWKRTFTQILNKGVVMESWKHKIFWVVQEPIYKNFETRYNLQDIGFHNKHSTVFALYDLKPSREKFDLIATRKTSASIDQLFASFRHNPNIPSLETFVKSLQAKIIGQAQISLRLDQPTERLSLDVKRPTSSGRVREDPDEEDN
jgi:hypothetical protein